ncbi:MAG: RrF2 family transcriptional regulator [Lachnospiraceae bacterium]|nr:RrF2 family transcriptional regulator [Lachnospiraceae bacterium]
MKISTRGRYALRLMLDLALNDSGTPLRIKQIAQRQDISDKYLEQIVSILNKARYVQSIRGPQGGYLLTKKPEEYTVGMILRLTEGSLAPVDCVEAEFPSCEKMEDCVTSIVWKKMNDAINDVIDNITLADLMAWQIEKNGGYSI